MHSSVNPVLPSNLSFERSSPINLVIGYEDFATGQRAMKSCQRLIDRLSHEFQFRTTVWKFDILRVPQLTEIATEDLAEADMVVISAHGPGQLPDEVKSWLEELPPKTPGGAKALIALLDDVDGTKAEESPVHCYLQQFARRANLDFFSRQCAAAETNMKFFSGGDAVSAELALSIVHAETEMRDWGINE